ncbi:MAG: cytochrome c oxidase subunit II [Planctomycetaceae bacterium]|nr:cytochrome c oxidase subunit II [Planctomycetaceae bacterium]MBT6154067.1 cytochrome c oxidase subunit II [Planctomycetaceae bacterium]MBT6485123.1 cytochrome c oxidase subunit II [Planctomycetaceae bacterium]MBT6495936.1 cytochrome c oxidase subunit II [Planctomycetaceae bacterium]
MFWPIVAIVIFTISPAMNWWFPGAGDPDSLTKGQSMTPLGVDIDNLFYLILIITSVVFVLTHIALGYVLFRGARDEGKKALFSHGSHALEVMWTIVPTGILIFISLYQLDVWRKFRVMSSFPEAAVEAPVAEVTARQFEWRIRYPAPGKKLQLKPQPDDLYTVNDLHVPTNRPVMIQLRSEDVQHSFFAPQLRVKQDALPGQVIPVWFEVTQAGHYQLTCAELCGWGHYKMKARIVAEPQTQFGKYLHDLRNEQNDDGVQDKKSGDADDE